MAKIELIEKTMRSSTNDLYVRMMVKELQYGEYDSIESFISAFRNRITYLRQNSKKVRPIDIFRLRRVNPTSVALWRISLRGDDKYMIYLIKLKNQ